jgi:hypothetical protein
VPARRTSRQSSHTEAASPLLYARLTRYLAMVPGSLRTGRPCRLCRWRSGWVPVPKPVLATWAAFQLEVMAGNLPAAAEPRPAASPRRTLPPDLIGCGLAEQRRWNAPDGKFWVASGGVGCPLRDLADPSLAEVDVDSPVRDHESPRAEACRCGGPAGESGDPDGIRASGSPHACVRACGTMLKHSSPASAA